MPSTPSGFRRRVETKFAGAPQSRSLLLTAVTRSVTTWLKQDFSTGVPFLETQSILSLFMTPRASYLALGSLPLFKGSCGSFHFLLFDAHWVPISHSGLSVSEHQKMKMMALLEGSISTSTNSQRGLVTRKLFFNVELVFQGETLNLLEKKNLWSCGPTSCL